jgi:hypothetical protein
VILLELINSISDLTKYVKNDITNLNSSSKEIWFRGVKRSNFKLLPSVFRPKYGTLDEFYNERTISNHFIRQASSLNSISPTDYQRWLFIM